MTYELAHFGVKGMHWGDRKGEATGLHPDYTPRMQKSDENFGGKASVARVNQHMLNGKTHAQAANLETRRAQNRNMVIAGVAATAYVLAKHGDTALKLITAAAEANRTQDLVKNALEVSRDITNPKQNRQGVYNITTL